MRSIGIIGAGNLGRHLIELFSMNRYQKLLTVSDTKRVNLDSDITFTDNTSNIENSEYIFITVKPDQVKDVCEDIKNTFTDTVYVNNHNHNTRVRKTIVSSAAGVPIHKIRSWLENPYNDYNIVRMMPNIPISLGKGGIVWYSDNISSENQVILEKITKGPTSVWVKQEDKIDVATVLYGCNPAYISMFFNIYLELGKDLGFGDVNSRKLLLDTFKGTLELLEENEASDIIKDVASEGGATEKGLEELSKKGFNSIVREAAYSSLDRINKITESLN